MKNKAGPFQALWQEGYCGTIQPRIADKFGNGLDHRKTSLFGAIACPGRRTFPVEIRVIPFAFSSGALFRMRLTPRQASRSEFLCIRLVTRSALNIDALPVLLLPTSLIFKKLVRVIALPFDDRIDKRFRIFPVPHPSKRVTTIKLCSSHPERFCR
jgi:hypothetical protein